MSGQKEVFLTKEVEIIYIKKKMKQVLELKNLMKEMKNAVESTCSRVNQIEE